MVRAEAKSRLLKTVFLQSLHILTSTLVSVMVFSVVVLVTTGVSSRELIFTFLHTGSNVETDLLGAVRRRVAADYPTTKSAMMSSKSVA